MELITEFIFELLVEGILEGYTNYRKKKNPNYDNTKLKRVIDKIIKMLIIIIIFVLFILLMMIGQ